MKNLILITALTATSLNGQGLSIVLDYTYDRGYFSEGSAARASVEAAARDLGSHLANGQLKEINTRRVTGTSSLPDGSLTSQVTLQASFTSVNPSTGSTFRVSNFSAGADEVRIYVGMNGASSRTTANRTRVQTSLIGYGHESTLEGALDNAIYALDTLLVRNSDVLTGSYTGNHALYEQDSPYTVDYGALGGSASFSYYTDWQYDHTQEVGKTQYDLYSASIEELVYILGGDKPTGLNYGERQGITGYQLEQLSNAGWIRNIPEPSTALLTLGGMVLALRRRRA